MAIDPRVDVKICKGCNVRRSCARSNGIPPCAKQFFEPAQQADNGAITQLPPDCGKCIHKRVCPAWVLSHNNAMDVSINRCLYFEEATAQ